MKAVLILIAVLVVSACATTPTVKSVAGTYEVKADGDTGRIVFLENGIIELYMNGEKSREDKWKISKEGEIFIGSEIHAVVYRINEDSSITAVADIGPSFMNLDRKYGKREDSPKDRQLTYKKIK